VIAVTYAGRDRLRVDVRGHVLLADQPVEDGGDDTAPTPTEMFVSSLAACVAFYAERFLRRHGLPAEGLNVTADCRWAENPHRVGEIVLDVEAPGLTEMKREAFERVIDHCTVHNSFRVSPVVRVKVAPSEVASA